MPSLILIKNTHLHRNIPLTFKSSGNINNSRAILKIKKYYDYSFLFIHHG